MASICVDGCNRSNSVEDKTSIVNFFVELIFGDIVESTWSSSSPKVNAMLG